MLLTPSVRPPRAQRSAEQGWAVVGVMACFIGRHIQAEGLPSYTMSRGNSVVALHPLMAPCQDQVPRREHPAGPQTTRLPKV